ncbi:NupC/NupG family nucleoside CNT transporter [Rhodopila sp.]|jgi:CNT family concentrative nucleoside transporter|uniref:NupC/NupG family nucleoside CNT transporter n=1 Tax=Rhodopila sp. TaxID=2480087 RepID=UPI002C14B163|nr:nucleoside transporter C-terminal domain-containing protein [Rhodopila sp.]HVZ08040.1 nucleoside transporter C-terminal domain-containing protein [Rhodopila sp.]
MPRAGLGLIALLLLAFLCSEDRRRIPWRTVLCGVGLQLGFALLLLRVPGADRIMIGLNDAANALHAATLAGTQFVFGYLGGGAPAFAETHPGASFILAFQALPLVLTISALASLLFHWGILQHVTAGFAWLLRRVMGVGGALGLGAAVHIFVGMVEAPLLVRPYLLRMQRGELFALMTCGMAGVAGTVMVIYASFLAPLVPHALGHILAASVISTPAGLAVAALMVPFGPSGRDEGRLVIEDPPVSAIDALVKGTLDGIPILASIVAVLIVTIAVVALANMALGLLPAVGGEAITLERIFTVPFRPVMWLIGVPWTETAAAAALMATKTVLNEFVAYLHFSSLPADAFSPRTRIILTYALCGFANFGSLGIMIGGLGAMVPSRRAEVVALGPRTILSGTIATCMSGAVAGALLG